MKKLWSDRAWDDYLYWQTQDKKTLKRINELVKSIEREGLTHQNHLDIERLGVEGLMR